MVGSLGGTDGAIVVRKTSVERETEREGEQETVETLSRPVKS